MEVFVYLTEKNSIHYTKCDMFIQNLAKNYLLNKYSRKNNYRFIMGVGGQKRIKLKIMGGNFFLKRVWYIVT